MILKRFFDEKLAQASYLIGCAASGDALVIDPNRDIEPYLGAAESERLRITQVAETHIHADFVSGSRELAARTGATLYLSDEGGPDWRYAFAQEDGAVLLKDGETFHVGTVRVDVRHTPGHTPEHLIFLITDGAHADRPIGALTGDFVFVGDVGRPDLLEKAAGAEGTMEEAARLLFHSLQRFKEQPDYLQIWPGHGAGSACGKGISSVPNSTVGYEKLFNWAFPVDDVDEFVRMVLAGQPEPPTYFAMMKRVNQQGPPVLGGFRRPDRLPNTRLAELLDREALVVDTRPVAEYAAGHVPGTINIPLNRSFPTWAGWLIPYHRSIYLIADEAAAREAARDLAMIGLDAVEGYFGAAAVDAWTRAGRPLVSIPQITSTELARRIGADNVAVLDVRGRAEWEAGHLRGVRNIPLGHLADRLDEIPRDRPVVVHCQSGARSAIAASVLRARGFEDVVNLTGGYADWQAAGHPTQTS